MSRKCSDKNKPPGMKGANRVLASLVYSSDRKTGYFGERSEPNLLQKRTAIFSLFILDNSKIKIFILPLCVLFYYLLDERRETYLPLFFEDLLWCEHLFLDFFCFIFLRR